MVIFFKLFVLSISFLVASSDPYNRDNTISPLKMRLSKETVESKLISESQVKYYNSQENQINNRIRLQNEQEILSYNLWELLKKAGNNLSSKPSNPQLFTLLWNLLISEKPPIPKSINTSDKRPDIVSSSDKIPTSTEATTTRAIPTTTRPISTTTEAKAMTPINISPTTKPITTTTKPISTTTEAITTTTKPISTTTEAIATTTKPISTTTEAITTTPKPISTTTEAIATTTKPISTTTEAIATTPRPISTTTEAIATTPKATTTTEDHIDDDDDTARPIKFIDTKSFDFGILADKMPKVEHGSIQYTNEPAS